jgi:hypothetical protein
MRAENSHGILYNGAAEIIVDVGIIVDNGIIVDVGIMHSQEQGDITIFVYLRDVFDIRDPDIVNHIMYIFCHFYF